MDPERWQRIREIFQRLVDRPAGERTALLERACGDDRQLRREVEELLAADRGAESFLERPVLEEAAAPAAGAPAGEATPQIGRYRLLERIGRGGMASVHLAVRDDDEYRQRVAIKVFGYGIDRRDLLRRFRAERQILASLQHPSIARLLDGGTTALRRRAAGTESAEAAESLHDMGLLRSDQGDLGEAETLLRRALDLRRQALGAEHPAVAESLSTIGVVLRMRGEYAEAESMLIPCSVRRSRSDEPSSARNTRTSPSRWSAWQGC